MEINRKKTVSSINSEIKIKASKSTNGIIITVYAAIKLQRWLCFDIRLDSLIFQFTCIEHRPLVCIQPSSAQKLYSININQKSLPHSFVHRMQKDAVDQTSTKSTLSIV